MPTISSFYGIVVFFHLRDKEHNPPHIHAIMADYEASFLLSNGEILEGDFPPKGAAMVKEFINDNQFDLEEMWEFGEYRKLPPLK